jgi:hypothetical protein
MKAGLLVCALVVLGILSAEPAKTAKPNLYDTKAEGKEQIAKALAQAQKENKRVLLKFGANW